VFIFIQFLSISRIPVAIAFAFVIITLPATTNTLLTCLALLITIELSDYFDGILARRYGVASELGATLDPYTDSVSRLIIFWALAEQDLALALVPLTMAIRDVTVSYCRIMLAKRGQTVSARWSGKAKAVVQAGGGIVLLLLPLLVQPGNIIFAVVSWIVIIVTALSSLEYIRDALLALTN